MIRFASASCNVMSTLLCWKSGASYHGLLSSSGSTGPSLACVRSLYVGDLASPCQAPLETANTKQRYLTVQHHRYPRRGSFERLVPFELYWPSGGSGAKKLLDQFFKYLQNQLVASSDPLIAG